MQDITDVYSHPVALGQCMTFLKHDLPHAALHPAADTAGSAVYIRDQGKKSAAAIAGSPNAPRLGLQILQKGIEDNPNNTTRFLVLGRTGQNLVSHRNQANKTSLLLEHLDNRNDDLAPGILYRALGCFAEQNVALTKIEIPPSG